MNTPWMSLVVARALGLFESHIKYSLDESCCSQSTWRSRVTYEYSLDESCCSSNGDCDMCHQVFVCAYLYVTRPVALG